MSAIVLAHWRAVSGKIFASPAFGLAKVAGVLKPPPSAQAQKKAPQSHRKVEFLQNQIEADVGHCDLFQWLIEILTPLKLTPIGLDLSVRDADSF